MSPRSWARDLALGARLAVTGGPRGWTRTLLTGVGVGLGVALLLIAASIPNLLDSRGDRSDARAIFTGGDDAARSARSFLYITPETAFRGETIHGVVVRAEGDDAPEPPGTKRLPGPGEMVVSSALRELLESPEGALLRDRFPYRDIGTIGDAGLIGPGELTYYAGDSSLTEDRARRGDAFGYDQPRGRDLGGFLLLIIVITCVVLLLPVLVFIATAVRFGGEQRDRRLAALRLVGADGATARRIAAGESLAGALFGLVAGAGFLILLREVLGRVTVWNVNVFPADLVPSPGLAAVIAVIVPACAVVVTVFSLRGISIEPLGVVREAAPRPRRLWWRLLMVAAGGALLIPMAGDIGMMDASIGTYQIAAGALLALTGLTTLLPWLVEAAVKRLRGGPVPWQLAVRRLQLSSGTAARAVSGIVVAAAGAIALQMLFQAMQNDFMRPTGMDSARAQLEAVVRARSGGEAREMIERFSATKGVVGVIGTIESGAQRPGPPRADEPFVPTTALTVGDCRSLAELADLPSCTDGDVFIALSHGAGGPDDDYVRKTARAGAPVDLRRADGSPEAGPLVWRIPATARTVDARPDPMGLHRFGILATPSSIDTTQLDVPQARAMIRVDPGMPDAAEYVRNTAAHIDPALRVRTLLDFERDAQYSSVRKGIFVAATATMVLIALSLLVSTLEQLRDRKRLLAMLVAFGTRRTTLGWSVLWQTAVPIGLGLALSVAGGLGLGVALLRLIGKRVEDWWVFLPVTGVGAALILGVTVLSLPALWRVMRPDGLRTE
ncbi:FtsX-like permease family protein [Streptomyces sp. SP18CS02]|uniref:FtsX-like permease family protein n=1 Tax=Streptomyces sp. SP18CS02 TaxID=3002531 RepID=UPI002E7651BB|nr:FtsX-like permease family protein [Streptomyces sp. SP18CS02]MEE1756313.1 ABC transporter permease [Streptomyces sp. SP18CS02]